jgi:cobalt-zinc-cadmium efflux system protein
VAAVRDYLATLPGVTDLHDLHIWAMSTTETVLTVHLVIPGEHDGDALLRQAARELHDRFGIEHVTVQIERDASASGCASAIDTPVV